MPKHLRSILDLIADESWREALADELPHDYAEQIAAALAFRLEKNECLAPPLRDVLRALNLVPIDEVRVVIVGQDPYPTEGHADGLAFSVREGVRPPSALQKIFAELERDLEIAKSTSGDLTPWASQGVLLINAALTTTIGTPWAHRKIDWMTFTRAVLRTVARRSPPSAILLWGDKARPLGEEFDGTAHLLITSDHPCGRRKRGDPNGTRFRGSHPFSLANAFLGPQGRAIEWALRAPAI